MIKEEDFRKDVGHFKGQQQKAIHQLSVRRKLNTIFNDIQLKTGKIYKDFLVELMSKIEGKCLDDYYENISRLILCAKSGAYCDRIPVVC